MAGGIGRALIDMPPGWPYVMEDNYGSAQPQTPAVVGKAPQLPPPPREGIIDRLKRNITDPRVQMFMLAMGHGLAQPKSFGQTGTGKAADAILSGYQTLARADLLQGEREAALREEARKEKELKLKEQQVNAGVEHTKAQTAATQQQTAMAPEMFNWEKEKAGFSRAMQEKTLAQSASQFNAEMQRKDREYNQRRAEFEADQGNKDKAHKMAQAELSVRNARLRAETAKILEETSQIANDQSPDSKRKVAELWNKAYTSYLGETMPGDPNAEGKAQAHADEVIKLAGATPPTRQKKVWDAEKRVFVPSGV